ncbi:serine carboxypeptidase S28-domain-containing protein [Zalerion maritima]|uniref:Serine carboxypeptidase S28-domain-containing protein n=1 Tax=Zalerion maritima TaxID=339359 RepID=A0AAD5WQC6_9PEZI|nr:serine carboxypeptidase S28-domain-containing protein [Zalerion maritima]
MKWKTAPVLAALSLLSLAISTPTQYSSPSIVALDERELAPHFFTGRRPKGVKSHTHPDIQRVGNATFKQLLDHRDEENDETFKQRYWYDAASWKGEGSPIFLFNPGETDAEDMVGYLSNETLPGMLADLYGGAVLVVEHRYFGKSLPFNDLTAETLQYLNLPNSIYDMTYFASSVSLPFDEHNHTHPSKSPWVLIGGSYSGALAAWTQQIDPGTFVQYHASSAVVQAIYDFDEYFTPIEAAIPRNCSKDIQAVISYVDETLESGTDKEVDELKAMFGLAKIEHHDDFAELLTIPIWKWQSAPRELLEFCDHIEMYGSGKDDSNLSPNGVGLATALDAYAEWINETVGPRCEKYNCDSYNNPEAFNNPSDTDGDRQWDWFLCNEPFAFWQVGPSSSSAAKKIVSSFLTTDHWQRRCDLWFPETKGFISGSSTGFTVEHENMFTGGWNASYSHVTFVDGEFDPWIGATLNSPQRPGGPLASTDEIPIWVIKGGNHVDDLVVEELDRGEVKVVEEVYDVHGKWLEDWESRRKKV